VLCSGVLFAFLIFALQGAVSSANIQANGSNALSYLGQVLGGGWLARVMVLAVALSAVGGALARQPRQYLRVGRRRMVGVGRSDGALRADRLGLGFSELNAR
jgi:hypothetical protein